MEVTYMDRTVIKSTNIITSSGLLDGYVTIVGDKIEYVGPKCAAGDKVLDVGDRYVSPGFIDIHTHGGGGHDFMDGTVQAIELGAKAHLKHGTTSIVPTTLTCPDEELFSVYKCFQQAKLTIKDGPNLLGLHLEGPYFAESQKGAQDSKYIQSPTADHYNKLLDASNDIIRVSAACELDGGIALGEELKRRGILASIGHSDAVYSEVCEAFKHGYTHVTHLYSGMSALHRIGPYRQLGVVESAYLIDGMTVEIIADGKHLPPELLKFIVKCKALDDICLVTDSMRGAGLKDGSRVLLGSLKNGQDVILKDGVAMMPDLKAFAGSVCTADRCVRTMVKLAGVSIVDAVKMMAQNPARIIGIQDIKGILASGMDADICIFDDDINIGAVIVGGQILINQLT